ncbi:MAG: DUF4304 domain-containing protein [Bryobacteraceae bacterium]
MDKTLSTSLSLLHRGVLKPAGFLKKGGTFSRIRDTHTELFNIQSSQWNGPWGRSFYVNCGLVFVGLLLEHSWQYFPGTQWGARIEAVVAGAPGMWGYSEETIDSTRDKLGEYILQASETLTNDLAKYKQTYLDRIARIALHQQGLTA